MISISLSEEQDSWQAFNAKKVYIEQGLKMAYNNIISVNVDSSGLHN